jgi:uncharacterized protein (UPF0335 family)
MADHVRPGKVAKRRGQFNGALTVPLDNHSCQTEAVQETAMEMDTVGMAGGRIRSFVERIEQLEIEISELTEGKKEVFAEAKGEGYDVKILREIIKLRKQNQDERDEHETLLETYMRAMEEADEPEHGLKAA